MANSVTLGRAYVVIGATIGNGFTATLAKVQSSLAGLGQSMQKIGAPIAAVGASITSALEGATYAAIKGQEAFADMATRTGASVEFLSEVGYAAGLADVEIGALETALIRMSLAQQKLRNGSPATLAAFNELKLTAQDLEGLSVDERFTKIAEALSKIGDQGKKATIAREIFGKGGVSMLPVIAGGAAGLQGGRAEAVRVGASVTTEAAQKADEASDMFRRLKEALQGLANAVGNALMGRMIQLATVLTNLVARTSEYVRQHPELITQAQKLGQALLVVGGAFLAIGTAVEGLSYVFSAGGILTIAAAMILYLTGALDGLIAKWNDTVMTFQVGGKSIGEWLALIGEAWRTALPSFGWIAQGIFEAFASLWDQLKQAASTMLPSIGGYLLAGFYKAIKGVTDAFIALIRWISDVSYGVSIGGVTLVDDKLFTDRMNALDAYKKKSDAMYGGLVNDALGNTGAKVEFKVPNFTKVTQGLQQIATDTKDILGKPIADAIGTAIGTGESKVREFGDIFKDLGRGFPGAPSATPTANAATEGAMRAVRIGYEARGAFSAKAAGQLTGKDSVLVKGQEKQIVLQERMANGIDRIADSSDDALTYD